MSKVISFKVSDEDYDKLRESGKSFKEIFEPMVKQLLQGQNNDDMAGYTPSIPICKDCEYKTSWLAFLRVWRS